ncbi:nucleotide-binding universal stress UspA family protein [Kribbella steppae]|uniref:Nucleotide-binding universal stress UspA family protein n=1 Tax=Kribbella steppae TaxID=2512223 RepID=A0A4R2H3V5_9ACTN|nr:universal stress protein [Kribbella steppae]TCO20303.1 nucleotide-binding universal stress UspA family protein [Kribbella steppae]
MRPRPVVAGVDGSPAAEAAVRWATAEAASRGAELHLIQAVTPLRPGQTEKTSEHRAAADQIVGAAVALARELDPDVAVDGRLEDGSPSAALIKASADADLVVIGSRGLGVMLGALIGSTGLELAANARCPIVVVRPDLGGESGSRVVIGYDGSSASQVALEFGLDYADRHDLNVRVVAAQPPHTDLHRITPEELQAAVHDRDHGQGAELVQITGHPAEHLLRLSADARLIVLGARGRGGFSGMLLGSVSQTVLHHADCPVAVIPAATIGG